MINERISEAAQHGLCDRLHSAGLSSEKGLRFLVLVNFTCPGHAPAHLAEFGVSKHSQGRGKLNCPWRFPIRLYSVSLFSSGFR